MNKFDKIALLAIFAALSVAAMTRDDVLRNTSPKYRLTSTMFSYEKQIAIVGADSIKLLTISTLKGNCLSIRDSTITANDSGTLLERSKFVSLEYVNLTINSCLLDSFRSSAIGSEFDSIVRNVDEYSKHAIESGMILTDPKEFRYKSFKEFGIQ